MTPETLTLVIDESGQVTVEGRSAVRRLAARPGRYRLLPSPANLVLLERIDGPAAATGQTAISGDIDRSGGLIDIIHFVLGAGWSGQLTVIDATLRKTLYFRRGEVRTASSTLPEDRIGAILFRYGRISAAQLEEALAQVTQEQRFGQILVDGGTISQHDLYQFVRKQVEEIFYSVLALRRGEFYFYRTADEDVPPSQLQLSTKQLLFEGVRRIDELGYFRQRLPGSDVVLVRREPPPPERLPPREARVLALVDGERDLGAIARESHLGEFEATKVCFQLLQGKWVQVRSTTPATVREMPIITPGQPGQPGNEHLLRHVAHSYNDALERVFKLMEQQGRREVLLRALESFLSSAGEFAPLFVGVSTDESGRIPVDQLLANLNIAPARDRVDYLNRGMREVLHFELFIAGEAFDRAEEQRLQDRLNDIVRSVS